MLNVARAEPEDQERIRAAKAIVERLAEPCAHCDARHLSVCQAVDEPHLNDLASLVTTIRLSPHDTMLSEGERSSHYYNITEGTVKIYKLLPDGRQQIVGFAFAGDFIGLAVRDTYAYSVEAVTNARACRFERNKLEQLLARFPRMEHQLRAMASDELAVAQEQMLLLGRKTAKERVASFLVQLSVRARKLGLPGSPITLTMGRADIADYLGLTIETVSRTFTSLKTAKLIELGAGNSVKLDLAGLSELSGGWN